MKGEEQMIFIQKIQRNHTLPLTLIDRARSKKAKRLNRNAECGSLRCGEVSLPGLSILPILPLLRMMLEDLSTGPGTCDEHRGQRNHRKSAPQKSFSDQAQLLFDHRPIFSPIALPQCSDSICR